MSVTITDSAGKTAQFQAPLKIEVAAPVSPPVFAPRFPFRAIYCRDEEFAQCYPNAFDAMDLTAMECYIYTGTTNLKTRFDQLKSPHKGWSVLSSFRPNTTGGVFTLSDADCTTAVKSIATHPLNSHHYYIADEPDITNYKDSTGVTRTYTATQKQALKDKLISRVKLVHAADPSPETKVSLADFRTAQIPGWKGVVDLLFLSGYPFPNAVDSPTTIPTQAKLCDDAGIQYVGCLSCHDYQVNRPAYPTQSQLKAARDQWAATKAIGIALYIWYDAEGTRHLSQDPTMQQYIGSLLGM
jgi:hypothetical protein